MEPEWYPYAQRRAHVSATWYLRRAPRTPTALLTYEELTSAAMYAIALGMATFDASKMKVESYIALKAKQGVIDFVRVVLGRRDVDKLDKHLIDVFWTDGGIGDDGDASFKASPGVRPHRFVIAPSYNPERHWNAEIDNPGLRAEIERRIDAFDWFDPDVCERRYQHMKLPISGRAAHANTNETRRRATNERNRRIIRELFFSDEPPTMRELAKQYKMSSASVSVLVRDFRHANQDLYTPTRTR